MKMLMKKKIRKAVSLILVAVCCTLLFCGCSDKGEEYYKEAKSLYSSGEKMEALGQLEILLADAPKSDYAEDAKTMYAYIVLSEMKRGIEITNKMLDDAGDYLNFFVKQIRMLSIYGGTMSLEEGTDSLVSMNDLSNQIKGIGETLNTNVSEDILMDIDINLLDCYKTFISTASSCGETFQAEPFTQMVIDQVGSGRSYVSKITDIENSLENMEGQMSTFSYQKPE